MENLIDISRLYVSLKDIIEKKEEIEKIREIITKIHFSVQEIKLGRTVSQDNDLNTMRKISMYLLSILTNITSEQMKEYVQNFYCEGLNIAGLIFELLADLESEDYMKKHYYLFYCSVCYSLSNKEASSAVIGERMLSNIQNNNIFSFSDSQKRCWICICLTLSRKFKVLYKERSHTGTFDNITLYHFWDYFSQTLIENASCFVDGINPDKIFESILNIKGFLLKNDSIEDLFVVSLIYDVLIRMHSKSIWNVLREHKFSDEYLSILAKYDSKNVYELWESQLEALKYNQNGVNYLSDEIDKAIISMPTSSGKSFIAELAIVKSLENNDNLKCVYVASTRALTAEVENNLFYRLRRLGYNVAAAFDTDENDYENDLLNEINVLVVTPEKLDLLVRRKKDFLKKISIVIFDEFHKVSDNSRGWLLETLISWFIMNQEYNAYKILLMSAIVSNTTDLNKWLGNSEFKPIVSNWSPNRRIYGIVSQHKNKKNATWIDIRKNVKQVKTPYKLVFKYRNNLKVIKNIFDETTQLRVVKGGFDKDYNHSDSKYDRSFKFINFLNDNKILIYFFTKDDLENFIEYSKDYLQIKDNENLRVLKSFLRERLGKEHPLVKNIEYGVAYHHGDLPIEVRKEIEKSYKSGDIDILACTTTLSDGVNLPIKNFILGSFTSSYDSNYRLSIADFKNIVGRAGRAYIDTEGRIFLIRHPEYLNGEKSDYFKRLVFCEKEETNVISSMKDKFDDVYALLNELEEVVDLTLKDADKAVIDFIDRLQVFAFSLYEECADDLFEYEEFCKKLNRLLFVHQINEEKQVLFNEICNKYFKYVSGLDKNTLMKFNKTGLSYRSNSILKDIADIIAENENVLELGTEEIITRDIFEKIISLKEIKPKTYYYKNGRKNAKYVIDHYAAFLYWIDGKSFLDIRDTLFSQDEDISNRTQTCVNYINDMFLYKLPWAFSSLYVLSKDNLIVVNQILKYIPVKIKYGVNDIETIKLCTLGMESRELANKLTELYESDTSKDSEETLEKWITKKSFYYFQKNISEIDDISIRQISRVRTKLRKRTSYLRDSGRIECEVAGISFYDYRKLLKEKKITLQTELKFIREPENLYDEFAVRVETISKDKIGYIPSTYAEEIFDYIEADQLLKVKIKSLSYKKLIIAILLYIQ